MWHVLLGTTGSQSTAALPSLAKLGARWPGNKNCPCSPPALSRIVVHRLPCGLGRLEPEGSTGLSLARLNIARSRVRFRAAVSRVSPDVAGRNRGFGPCILAWFDADRPASGLTVDCCLAWSVRRRFLMEAAALAGVAAGAGPPELGADLATAWHINDHRATARICYERSWRKSF